MAILLLAEVASGALSDMTARALTARSGSRSTSSSPAAAAFRVASVAGLEAG